MLRRGLAVAGLAFAFACNNEKPAEKPVAPPPAETPKAPEKSADADCMGKVVDGPAQTHEWNGITWEQKGSTVSWTAPARDAVKIGAVTDIKESSEDNLANLKAFVDWFKTQKVDLIVVDGDTGTTKEGIASAITVLAGAGVPVFVTIGNGEGREAYKAAMESTRAALANVFDLVNVRLVHTPQADLVSLPGYFDASYLHAKDGCAYYPSDIEATRAIVKSAKAPVVIVSHGGPLQSGPQAVDRTTEDKHVGDPLLAKLIKEEKVPFGIFGNVHEAGGHATDVDGNALIAEKTPAEALYLNPGPSDAVGWIMNDKSESVGMASVLTVSGGKASYEMFRRSAAVAKKGK